MQLLIATGSQRLCPRREPVVPSHHREVEAITNLLPHRRLLRTLVEGEVPALVEFSHRISREHPKVNGGVASASRSLSISSSTELACCIGSPPENVKPSISPAWCRARTRRTMSLPSSVGAPSNGWL